MILTNIIKAESIYVFCSRKALSSTSVPFQDIFLVFKGPHWVDDYFFIDTSFNLSQKPTCMILKLRIWVAQESVPKTSSSKEPILHNWVDIAKEVRAIIGEIESFIKVLLNKTDPDELVLIFSELSENFAGLLFSCHSVMKKGWCHQNSTLSH